MPDWETVKRLGTELPEVEVARWYGTPGLKVAGKGFARLRDDGALVVMIDIVEREALMQEDPKTFYVTPHYEDHPAMLIRQPGIATLRGKTISCAQRTSHGLSVGRRQDARFT